MRLVRTLELEKWLINQSVGEKPKSSCGCCCFWICLASGAKITIEGRIGRIENEVAVPALAEVALDLALHRWRELAL